MTNTSDSPTRSALHATTQSEIIREYAANKARTTRFTCGAPRSAQLIGDGSRMLFLRSSSSEDTVTALWMHVHHGTDQAQEVMIADPRVLLNHAEREDVPAQEQARRERARIGGNGIVAYSVDDAGHTVVFALNGQLYVCTLNDNGGASSQLLNVHVAQADQMQASGPVLNPIISPDGSRVAYSTGSAIIIVDIASGEANAVFTVPQNERDTVQVGLAEFAAAEEMDRYRGLWWGPDSHTLIMERADASSEPLWTISDPANPADPGMQHRYPQALTHNAVVELFAIHLGEDGLHSDCIALIDWDNDAFEYCASVSWQAGSLPLLRVLNRLQTDEQIIQVAMPQPQEWAPLAQHMKRAVQAASEPHEHSVMQHDKSQSQSEQARILPLIEVNVLETHHNDQWIDIIHGTPVRTPSGKLICSVHDMEHDTNRLSVDGTPFTPIGWQVREVLDADDETVMCVVQRTPEAAPDVPKQWASTASDHDARSYDVVAIDYEGHIYPVTDTPGVWTAARLHNGLVVSGRDMDHAQSSMVHYYRGVAAPIANYSAVPGLTMNVNFVRLGERGLYAAIVAPTSPEYANAATLPVLMHPYGGPGFQEVTMSQAAYWDAQWWAEQGYLVVVADGRGTTGRGPKWDREIWHDLKRVTLEDQIDAVHAVDSVARALNAGLSTEPTSHARHSTHARHAGGVSAKDYVCPLPLPDLDKVAMIGWSYGGFLSATAVLDAPDVFAVACAGAPPTDWTLYDTCYTERYLGLDPSVYAHNSIIDDAPQLQRPLMLIHGFADDNVTVANTLRLSQALMAAGKAHTVLPLSGITHMTNDPTVARNLLLMQRDFLQQALQ